uniref:Putative secreted peptide n=1 Tax=Anopheles braziliensis TaxID=58242 RepID=A0A2M3ZSF7_9DIPT
MRKGWPPEWSAIPCLLASSTSSSTSIGTSFCHNVPENRVIRAKLGCDYCVCTRACARVFICHPLSHLSRLLCSLVVLLWRPRMRLPTIDLWRNVRKYLCACATEATLQ